MKPSWQVTKLTLWVGRRPLRLVQVGAAADPRGQRADQPGSPSHEPPHVVAVPAVPLAQRWPGKLPTWYSPAASHGSAISFVSASIRPTARCCQIDRRLDQQRAVAGRGRGSTPGRSGTRRRACRATQNSQAVEDQVADDRVVAVDRVAAAGVVQVVPPVVGPGSSRCCCRGRGSDTSARGRRPRRCG